MHLVHVRLQAAQTRVLPGDTAQRLMAHAKRQDTLQHVSVGWDRVGRPTLGLFTSCTALAHAEQAALCLVLRLLRDPAFDGWAVESCEAVPLSLVVADAMG